MDTENLKIKTYQTAIKNLPDYPSDAGYTAEMLKEAFDARSDGEIKEKHNALVDEFCAHTENTQNPHGVTAAQMGAYTKQEVDGMVGNISAALDELHAYAEALVNGGAE